MSVYYKKHEAMCVWNVTTEMIVKVHNSRIIQANISHCCSVRLHSCLDPDPLTPETNMAATQIGSWYISTTGTGRNVVPKANCVLG